MTVFIIIGACALLIAVYGIGYSRGFTRGREENPFIRIRED